MGRNRYLLTCRSTFKKYSSFVKVLDFRDHFPLTFNTNPQCQNKEVYHDNLFIWTLWVRIYHGQRTFKDLALSRSCY